MVFTLDANKARPVALIGGGALGRRIACIWTAGGWHVNFFDPDAEQRNAAILYAENNESLYSSTKSMSKLGRVRAYESLEEAVKDAWTVIETVSDDLSSKIDTFAELERFAPEDSILASNSSSYKSGEMLAKVRPETKSRIMNTHYFKPPDTRVVEMMTDGETEPAIFPFYIRRFKEVGLHPIIAHNESTGFVLSRIWAAVQRECLTVLAENITTPEELDQAGLEAFSGRAIGPCAIMDATGLDAVQSVERHYCQERELPTEMTVDFLQNNYIENGRLGAKGRNGGLYAARETGSTTSGNAVSLFVIDIGATALSDPLHSGRILVASPDAQNLRTLVSEQSLPDSLDISIKTGRIYWTNMGEPNQNDGTVQSCNLDGSDVRTLIPPGAVHTPKQIVIDKEDDKLYFCDREGMRVMRCSLDGSQHETIIQTGDWQNEEDAQDPLRFCVGIALNKREGKLYWTQKGPSKGGKGRIFRADIDPPRGEDAASRSDIQTIFSGLPEPIDLEIDEQDQTLYWTDRGEPPLGNSLNRARLDAMKTRRYEDENPGSDLLARHFHEAIGLKLDPVNRHVYTTDMGGSVYKCDMDGKNKRRLCDEDFSFSGIGLIHV